ncbi:MAG: TVP38/TMEM64 family protein [Anaerolineae bacterium]|nr:TVP38/TMEM64 family protein [Anaerolineae bacterium]
MTQSNEKEYQIKTSPLPVPPLGRLWSSAVDGARKYRGPLLVVFILAVLGLLGWQFQKQTLAAFSMLQDQEAVSAYIQKFGILGPLVLGVGHYLQVIIAFIPGHVFVLAGGYLYGFLPGLALNMLFVVTASQFSFFLAKKAGRPLVGKFVDAPTLDKWQSIADKRGITFFTIAFILPVFPSDAMNFVAGLSGMDGRKFLIANFFGRLPSVVLMSFIGAYGLEFSNTVRGLLVVAVVLVYVVGRYVILQIERQHSGGVYKQPRSQPHRESN